MFETYLQRFLAFLGAADQVIAVMGPGLTILVAWAAGGAVAQFLKFPVGHLIRSDFLFDWLVRAIAVAATVTFAHLLSDSIPWVLELAVGITQPLAYHLSLAVIRKRWPWFETRTFVGSMSPPARAYEAEAQRQADKRSRENDMNPPDGA